MVHLNYYYYTLPDCREIEEKLSYGDYFRLGIYKDVGVDCSDVSVHYSLDFHVGKIDRYDLSNSVWTLVLPKDNSLGNPKPLWFCNGKSCLSIDVSKDNTRNDIVNTIKAFMSLSTPYDERNSMIELQKATYRPKRYECSYALPSCERVYSVESLTKYFIIDVEYYREFKDPFEPLTVNITLNCCNGRKLSPYVVNNPWRLYLGNVKQENGIVSVIIDDGLNGVVINLPADSPEKIIVKAIKALMSLEHKESISLQEIEERMAVL